MSYRRFVFPFLLIVLLIPHSAAADPWADTVVSYSAGSTAAAGFTNPATSLGAPERFTGEGVFPSAVTMFNPAFGTDEIVSIGEGGSLTLQFDDPIEDDPQNLYGVDFILFGNAGFVDSSFPSGVLGSPASLFGAGLASIEVSANGVDFFAINEQADGLFPTQGYLDTTPFQSTPGSIPSNFLKPVDPSLTISDFDGLDYRDALLLYDGSGGGTPIDIASTGLSSISEVRISMLDDNDPETQLRAEIDAIANVPEPASALLFCLPVVASLVARRRRTMV